MNDARRTESDDRYPVARRCASAEALAWVGHRTPVRWRHSPGDFDRDREAFRAILSASDKIPFVFKRGPYLYNLWQDKANPRGLWRRTTLDSYRSRSTEWDVLSISTRLDAMKARTGSGTAARRCTRSSPWPRYPLAGRADASVIREFDLGSARLRNGWIYSSGSEESETPSHEDALSPAHGPQNVDGDVAMHGLSKTVCASANGVPRRQRRTVPRVARGVASISEWACHVERVTISPVGVLFASGRINPPVTKARASRSNSRITEASAPPRERITSHGDDRVAASCSRARPSSRLHRVQARRYRSARPIRLNASDRSRASCAATGRVDWPCPAKVVEIWAALEHEGNLSEADRIARNASRSRSKSGPVSAASVRAFCAPTHASASAPCTSSSHW